jgi:hypothetical protein
MGIPLRPQETVIYPQPYVENQPYKLIITSQRIVDIHEGLKEVDAAKLTFVGRLSDRPLLKLSVLLAMIALPLLIIAGVNYLGIRNKPTAVPPDETRPWIVEKLKADVADVKSTKITCIVLAAIGALCALGAKKTFKKKHYVMIQGSGKVLKIPTKDEAEQNQILVTVQGAQSSAKAMANAAAAMAPQPPPRR